MSRPNDEGQRANVALPVQAQNLLCNSTNDEGVSKAFDTLRAQLEMCGCGLHQMADRGYFVSRGNVSQQLPDLRAVRQMLVLIGGVR